ncbi:hypothetical protein BCR37DRAFT_70146 [Protomyces lactucae-debilis]|uniref:Monooxygenase n=1 Tax=Protomyces lactucae-debilis TaxID=2754530 RepID=A0A1Y2F954_PROLT|nr:uncharacterized protein BCR37DRAFT_70146 [Protomyces lactucae-debilis]ORY80431.1 hypothetical protein BCR37DRAFT_70146 [Protomyces lactucae-debilis]
MASASDYDVIVVGAGISGINAGYRLQTEIKGCNYTILEARDVLGGTWSLFKYPGVRSDSDLFTFGFPWKPWGGKTRFAQGDEIVSYMTEAAEEYGIDKRIQYGTSVKALNWNSEKSVWSVSVEKNGKRSVQTANFLVLGTGYYDYKSPLETEIPGIKNFDGTVVHPQFWPEDLDYANKKVVIIGSGATAVTILPNMAEKAKHVTMLQRSPGYVMTLPNAKKELPRFVPSGLRWGYDYFRYLILPYVFFTFCRTFPNAARKIIRAATTKALPKNVPHDPHFNPSYNPWEQRLCMSPDGDFFQSMHSGKANVVTGKIQTVTKNGITLENGEKLDADIIITATGLKLLMAGGAAISLDNKPLEIPEKFLWRGMMLQDCPNLAVVLGYTNASWTLGADCTALVVTRLLKAMRERGQKAVTPHVEDPASLTPSSVFNLSSTYVTKNRSILPKAADSGPWKARSNYFKDYAFASFGTLSEGLIFS